nr:universal stress protein A-like protein [Ipomoea batatas]
MQDDDKGKHSSLYTNWIFDTGVTDHIINSVTGLFNSFRVQNVFVVLPTGIKEVVTHIGSVKLTEHISLKGVLCVPGFELNLISMGKGRKEIGLAKEDKGLYRLLLNKREMKNEPNLVGRVQQEAPNSAVTENLVEHETTNNENGDTLVGNESDDIFADSHTNQLVLHDDHPSASTNQTNILDGNESNDIFADSHTNQLVLHDDHPSASTNQTNILEQSTIDIGQTNASGSPIPILCRSTRTRTKPSYLKDYHCHLVRNGASDVLQAVEADLKRAATKVIEKAKDLCKKKGVKDTDMAFDVVDGDARNVACDAVDKHHASLLVLGSHGYGTFKRAVLGSADRVRRLKPKRMQISWRDRTILEDNGIYTMRHMESYLGQSVSRWYCGIVKGDRYMLNDLRKKFMHDILVSNINSHKHSVIQRASEHDRNVFGRAS